MNEMSQYGFTAAPDPTLLEVAIYGTVALIALIFFLLLLAVVTLPIFFASLLMMEFGLRGVQNSPDPVGKYAKIFGLVFRSLRRNLLRTSLTYAALFVLTAMITFIYSIVSFLGKFTAEKEGAQMVVMSEKFSIPSMMKPGYPDQLKGVIETKLPPEYRPKDLEKNMMTWSFVGGTLDPKNKTPENSMFLFALDPEAVANGMMSEQGLSREDLGDQQWQDLLRVIELVKQDKRNIVVGEDRLKMLGKNVGDTITMSGLNYKDIEFEFHIVGAFPSGSRMGMNAAMRYDYLRAKLDNYKSINGKDHPVADRCVNLVWVRMPNKESFERLAAIVNDPGTFNSPAVKMETFSAAVGSFLESFKDIFWGMKYIIMPAIVAIMCLVIGITITIGVRERWTEMAVLKVLGFQPWQVMAMIVSEAVLIGVFGGLLSTWVVYFLPRGISWFTRTVGIKFAFFDNFRCPDEILILGPVLGILVGVVGAFLPSWNARKVKVSEVFAQVA